MTIRFATLQDVPALVDGGERMHALTRFKNQPFVRDKITRSFSDLIAKGQGKYVCLVAEDRQHQVAGALVGVLEQQIFSNALTASIMHFDVLPEARAGGHGVRLLKAFEQWARNRKVFEIGFGINSGAEVDKLARFAERMGYRCVGSNHVLTL